MLSNNSTPNNLTQQDFDNFSASYLTPEIVERAGFYRVANEDGAEMVGQKPTSNRSFDGIAIPYFRIGATHASALRLRRDTPDYRIDEHGDRKEEGKYLGPPQRSPQIYNPYLSWPHVDAARIFIVEGEKKSLALARYFHERNEAVRVIGLAGVWAWSGTIGKEDHPDKPKKVPVKGLLPELAQVKWPEKEVAILFDVNVHTNKKVQTARRKLANHLVMRGAKVLFIELPDDLPTVNGIDDLLALKGPDFVADLFEQQTRKATLQAVRFYASEQQDFVGLTAQVWDALDESEGLSERVHFWSGGTMVRVQPQGDRVRIEELTPDRLSYALTILAKWYKTKADGSDYLTTPPKNLLRHMLAAPQVDTPLPTLTRVVIAPVFSSQGELITTSGFHEPSCIYYLETFDVLAPPARATAEDAKHAVRFLISDVLCDFPFASDADRANAIGLALLPFVRDMIAGPTPLHLIEASVPGSGKGLLANALLLPSLGEGGIGVATQPEDDAEWRKVITSNLTGNKGALLLDNITHTLDSGVLAAALTAGTWDDRILGTNRTANAPVRLAWVATGNNPTLSSEMTRRTVRIRLTPATDKPEERDDFKHPVLAEWVVENRAAIVQALHTLVLHWIAQGKPNGKATLGSYERWARVIGGILECAGVSDFLANYREFRDRADVERTARAALCNEWHERIEGRGDLKRATANELYGIARDIDGLPLQGQDESGRVKSLGRYLAANEGVCPEHVERGDEGEILYTRRFRVYKAGSRKGTILWGLELLEEA